MTLTNNGATTAHRQRAKRPADGHRWTLWWLKLFTPLRGSPHLRWRLHPRSSHLRLRQGLRSPFRHPAHRHMTLESRRERLLKRKAELEAQLKDLQAREGAQQRPLLIDVVIDSLPHAPRQRDFFLFGDRLQRSVNVWREKRCAACAGRPHSRKRSLESVRILTNFQDAAVLTY